MKQPFTIGYNGITLTKPITDGRRAALAYDVLYQMADSGARVLDEFSEQIKKDELYVEDSAGTRFPIDPPYYKEPADLVNTLADKKMEDARKNGVDLDRKDAYPVMCDVVFDIGYPVEFCTRLDPEITVPCVPLTHDFNRASEMYNFLKYGLNPDVTLSMDRQIGYDARSKAEPGSVELKFDKQNLGYLCIMDQDHKIDFPVHDEPNWPQGLWSQGLMRCEPMYAPAPDDMDFTNAVAAISESAETQMEQ